MSTIKNLFSNFSLATFWEKQKTPILIFLLLIVSIIFVKIYLDTSKTKNEYERLLKLKDDTVQVIKDINGNLHSRIRVFESDKKNIDAFYGKTIDSIAALLKLKEKQIGEYINITTKTTGGFVVKIDTIVKPKAEKDSIGDDGDFAFSFTFDTIYSVQYKDQWIDFKGKYSTYDQNFSGDYITYDSLTFVTFYKKTGFLKLGKKDWFLDVSSANPAAVIKNIRNFKILRERQKRFGVGPFMGVTLGEGMKVNPVFGIGVSYDIIRF